MAEKKTEIENMEMAAAWAASGRSPELRPLDKVTTDEKAQSLNLDSMPQPQTWWERIWEWTRSSAGSLKREDAVAFL
eukprot:1324530-Amorphochlora_amoeboformis.AAC.3